jgi:hypothetical protein
MTMMERAQRARRAGLKKKAKTLRTRRLVSSGGVTASWASEQLRLGPTQTKRVLAAAGILPLLVVEARGGRRLPVFETGRS